MNTEDLTIDQRRVLTVLERMAAQVREDPDYAFGYGDAMEAMLNRLSESDFFGTEAQNDPRGDMRDEAGWSLLSRVQGVDE